MFWMLVAILAIVAGGLAMKRKRPESQVAAEPWRASLGDEEPLDMEEIRRAEEEWLEGNDGWEEEDGEPAFR